MQLSVYGTRTLEQRLIERTECLQHKLHPTMSLIAHRTLRLSVSTYR